MAGDADVNWHPIDSAPKTPELYGQGPHILLCGGFIADGILAVTVGWWQYSKRKRPHWRCHQGYYPGAGPTHWMPLPPPA